MREQDEKNTLPEGWAWATINELIDIGSGLFKDGDWIETKDQNPMGEVKLIQLADIGDGVFRNRSDRFMDDSAAKDLKCTFLKKGDVLIARMPDPIARACMFPFEEVNKYVTVVDVAVVRVGENSINSRLLMHFINSPAIRKQAEQLQTGTTRKRISRGNLSAIKLPIPPLMEQKRIVSKIEELIFELDKVKLLLDKTLHNLKIYRQALLRDAFEGTLSKNWRNNNSVTDADILIQSIDFHRNNEYVQNLKLWRTQIKEWEKKGKKSIKPIRPNKSRVFEPVKDVEMADMVEMPTNWSVCRVGQIADLISGFAFKSKDYVKEGAYQLIRMGNLYDNKLDLNRNAVYLPDQVAKDYVDKFTANENDILLSLTGTKNKRDYGFVVKVPPGAKNLLVNQRILLLKSLVSDEFLYYLMQTQYFRDQFFSFETGGGSQGNVSSVSVEQIVVSIPPLNEQYEIVRILKQQLTSCSMLENDIETKMIKIQYLHQSILNMALEGRLVSQDPMEESASTFLARLHKVNQLTVATLKAQVRKIPKRKKQMSKKQTIEEVLKTSHKAMNATDVWLQSVHSSDIEKFYQELKSLEKKIKVTSKGTETMITLIP